ALSPTISPKLCLVRIRPTAPRGSPRASRSPGEGKARSASGRMPRQGGGNRRPLSACGLGEKGEQEKGALLLWIRNRLRIRLVHHGGESPWSSPCGLLSSAGPSPRVTPRCGGGHAPLLPPATGVAGRACGPLDLPRHHHR